MKYEKTFFPFFGDNSVSQWTSSPMFQENLAVSNSTLRKKTVRFSKTLENQITTSCNHHPKMELRVPTNNCESLKTSKKVGERCIWAVSIIEAL